MATLSVSVPHPDPGKDWASPRWFDFLRAVVAAEPVIIRDTMSFGLKAVAKALHKHGCIDTTWADGPADGLGAMVGAWWCGEEADRNAGRLVDEELMQEIMSYNEVDCRTMAEVVRFLRSSH